jgi:hypothetical protein
MASNDANDGETDGQLLAADVRAHVRRRLGRELDELLENAEELRGLARSLEDVSGGENLPGAKALRDMAVSTRAASMQTFIAACRTAGISARLHAWADVVGLAGDAEETDG